MNEKLRLTGSTPARAIIASKEFQGIQTGDLQVNCINKRPDDQPDRQMVYHHISVHHGVATLTNYRQDH